MKTGNQNSFYPTIPQSFGIMGIWILFTLLTGISYLICEIFFFPSFKESPVRNQLIFLLVYSLPMGAVILLQWKKSRNRNGGSTSFRFNQVSPFIVVVAVITALTGAIILEPFLDFLPGSGSIQKAFNLIVKPDILSFFLIAVAPAFLEEFLFRGIILEGFLKNYSATKAVLCSAILFGLVHGNAPQGISAFVLGLLIGWVYLKTNSLIPGIIIHFVNNSIGFFLVTGSGNQSLSFFSLYKDDLLYWVLMILALYICITGLLVLNSIFSEKTFLLPRKMLNQFSGSDSMVQSHWDS